MKPSIALSEQTLDLLSGLIDAKWFSRVGMPSQQYLRRVPDWATCERLVCGGTWSEFLVEGSNVLTHELFERSRCQYNLWNDYVDLAKPILECYLDKSALRVPMISSANRRVINQIRWDVLAGVMETQYSDLTTSNFCRRILDCYISGHFPCGWIGGHADGQPIVY